MIVVFSSLRSSYGGMRFGRGMSESTKYLRLLRFCAHRWLETLPLRLRPTIRMARLILDEHAPLKRRHALMRDQAPPGPTRLRRRQSAEQDGVCAQTPTARAPNHGRMGLHSGCALLLEEGQKTLEWRRTAIWTVSGLYVLPQRLGVFAGSEHASPGGPYRPDTLRRRAP